MSRRRVAIAVVVGVPLALVLALGIALAWLLTTAGGLDWAAAQARRHLPEGVQFERAEGRLAGPLALRGLRVRTPAASVRVARLEVDWTPWALLDGRVRVTRLALASVEVEPAAGDDRAAGATPPALPERLALPLRLAIERATVADVTLRLADGRVERLERLAATVTAGPEGLALSRLELAAPRADVSGDLRLDPVAPFAVDGALDWRLRPPAAGVAAMAGRLELGGSLEHLQARLIWHAPATATVDLDARLLRPAPEWRADLRLPAGPLPAWWDGAPDLAAGARLALAGSFERVAVRGDIDIDGLPTGPLVARVDAALDPAAVTLERLRLTTPRRPGAEIVAGGRIALGDGPPRLALDASWRGLAWPLAGTPAATSESGRVRLRGAPDDYRLGGDARLRSAATGDSPVRLEWAGSGSTAALHDLHIEAAWRGARLDAAVETLRWAAPGAARARLALRGLDPGALMPALSGRLGAHARLEARWGDQAPALDVVLERLDGELGGQAIDGGGRLAWGPEGIRVERLALGAGAARAEVSGRLGDALAFDWRLAVPDLGALASAYGGRIDASGRIEGARSAPRLTLDLEASALVAPGLRVGALEADGALATAAGERSDLRLSLRAAAAPGVELRTLEARLTGTPAAHRLEAELASDRGDAGIRVGGRLADGAWRGRLERATLTPAGRGAWTLAAPAALAWEAGTLEADEACWRRDRARLCAQGRAAAGGHWSLRLDARDVPVAAAGTYWRDDLDYGGRFDLHAELAAADGPVTGRVRLDLAPGRVTGTLAAETATLLDYGDGRVDLRLEPDTVRVEARLALADGGRVSARARLGRASPQPLDARVEARVADLGLLRVVAPSVARVEGRLRADLELGGTLAAPSLAGSARLEDGRLALAPLGIELSGLEAELGTDDDALRVTARAVSGEGRVQAEVRVRRTAAGAWAGSGRLGGEDFTAIDLPEARVVVSPGLAWTLDDRAVSVSGSVAVPQARITPRDLSGTVQVSPDAVIVGAEGEPPPPAVPGWRVRADVGVALGADVRIDAFGLEGRLGGGLRIEERPGQLTAASGELRVEEGTYTVYRQTLQIERGRVIFGGGPLADPGLDVRAVRRPRGVLVGVNVRGTLRQPRVELFSEPSMPESQQLSYLVAGLPLGDASGSEQATVAAAAAALARSRPGSRLAGELGVDEVTVDPGTAGEGASVVLGRYLSPRLYVGYGIGLMEQANSVRMRYELAEHWSLEARSGTSSGADLLYSIEVDSSVDAIPGPSGDGGEGAEGGSASGDAAGAAP